MFSIANVYDYSYKSMVARAQAMLAAVNALVAQAQASLSTLNPQTYYPATFPLQSIGGQALGGSYLATRPTHALFGEAGPEIASFIPVRKLQASGAIGSSFGGGMGGKIEIEMLLSPDLEARVMRNTLSEASQVIAKVRRTK